MTTVLNNSPHLRSHVTCPHCLHRYRIEETLWIAKHDDLPEDESWKYEKERFAPLRFTVEGKALDAKEAPCDRLACPQCRGVVPRELMEMPTIYCSLIGAPQSSKTYFLASMTHRLKLILRNNFKLAFRDADRLLNNTLTEYRNTLFHSSQPEKLTVLDKTTYLHESVVDQISVQGTTMIFPKPFVYRIAPGRGHPREHESTHSARALCLYDNSGEHYTATHDVHQIRVVEHMAKSGIKMFLFDPLQDARFRAECLRVNAADPQLQGAFTVDYDQFSVFARATDKIKTMINANRLQRTRGLLFVLLTKFDVWQGVLGERLHDPWRNSPGHELASLDLEYVESVSRVVKERIVERFFPELIDIAEDLAEPLNILYLPVSATGRSPEALASDSPDAPVKLGFRPCELQPVWVEVPLLYALCRGLGLIQAAAPSSA